MAPEPKTSEAPLEVAPEPKTSETPLEVARRAELSEMLETVLKTDLEQAH